MQRTITGFHADDVGEWVAELSCLHNQHVRHQPPFREAAWVEDETTRRAKVGTALDCPLCDRAELPDGLRVVRTTQAWNDVTAPAGLRRGHRVAAGVWGLLRIEKGQLRFVAETDPQLDVVLGKGAMQPIPPEVEHRIETIGEVRFHVEFLTR